MTVYSINIKPNHQSIATRQTSIYSYTPTFFYTTMSAMFPVIRASQTLFCKHNQCINPLCTPTRHFPMRCPVHGCPNPKCTVHLCRHCNATNHHLSRNCPTLQKRCHSPSLAWRKLLKCPVRGCPNPKCVVHQCKRCHAVNQHLTRKCPN